MYKQPFRKGQLIIKFTVEFPYDDFLTPPKLQVTESPHRGQADHALTGLHFGCRCAIYCEPLLLICVHCVPRDSLGSQLKLNIFWDSGTVQWLVDIFSEHLLFHQSKS